jgi:hypothetical protein
MYRQEFTPAVAPGNYMVGELPGKAELMTE